MVEPTLIKVSSKVDSSHLKVFGRGDAFVVDVLSVFGQEIWEELQYEPSQALGDIVGRPLDAFRDFLGVQSAIRIARAQFVECAGIVLEKKRLEYFEYLTKQMV